MTREEFIDTIGARLMGRRLKIGMSRKELVQATGLRKQQTYNIESSVVHSHGKPVPRTSANIIDVYAMCTALGITLNDLVEGLPVPEVKS